MGEITTYGMAATKLGVAVPSGKTPNECGSKAELNSVFNLDQSRLTGYANNECVMIDDIVNGAAPYKLVLTWSDGTTNIRNTIINNNGQAKQYDFNFKTNAKKFSLMYTGIGSAATEVYLNGLEIQAFGGSTNELQFEIAESDWKNVYVITGRCMTAGNTESSDISNSFIVNANGGEFGLQDNITEKPKAEVLYYPTLNFMEGSRHTNLFSFNGLVTISDGSKISDLIFGPNEFPATKLVPPWTVTSGWISADWQRDGNGDSVTLHFPDRGQMDIPLGGVTPIPYGTTFDDGDTWAFD